jgi:hypothetical protein
MLSGRVRECTEGHFSLLFIVVSIIYTSISVMRREVLFITCDYFCTCFAIHISVYPQFYFSITRSIINLSVAMFWNILPMPNCDAGDKLS